MFFEMRRHVAALSADMSAQSKVTLPRKILWDGEFPQADFYARGNSRLFAPALRDAANRAEEAYELPMGAR